MARRSRGQDFGLLIAVWCALPAGLGHAASVRLSPSAAQAVPGGFSFSGLASGELAAPPAITLTAPALSPQPWNAAATFASEPGAVAGQAQALTPVAAETSFALALPERAPAYRASTDAGAGAAQPARGRADAGARQSLETIAAAAARGGSAAAPSIARRAFDGAGALAATQDFEPAAAGPGAAAPALLAPAPKLPPYLRTASPEDEAHLARVYEAAMRSATGRAVLARVADLAGQGRQPVLIEVFDYRPSENFIGYLSLEWELVRLERSLVRGRPEEGAPTLIHELTHVLQAAGGILMGSLESELEANLHTLQVGRELGVTFKRGSMYESLARAFRQSPAAFIEAVDHNYPDYFRLLGGNLNKAEDQLLKEHATAERAVAEQEALLSGLRADYEVLRAEGHPEAALKEFHETQIQPARVQLGRYDAYLGAVRRDLRLLYTLPGRTRYVEFTRDLVKKMRSFRRRYRAQGAAGRTAPPLRLPSLEQAQTFQPRPLRPAAPRRKAGKAGAEAAPAPARPEGILILPAENADWAARALARLGESALGRRLLADVGRAARRRGRPFVLEVLRGTRHFELDYDWGTELILVSERNVKSSLDDAAPYLAKGLTEALRAEESAYHGLELPLEAWAAALETARELGVQPRAGTPLRSAQLRFAKPDLAEFTAWVRSFYLGVFMLSDRTSAEFAASLEPFRRRMERDRRRSEDYLRQRVATEALMASAAHPRAARNLYQDAEDLLVRLDIADAARELAWIERDRAALSDSREETLRRHASEAMERVRAYHAAAQAGGAQ